jgi:5'(3')-deoxyribonucleotidase
MAPAPKRICVDMDEVMADAIAEHLIRYNREFQSNLTKADLLGKRFWQIVPENHHEPLDELLRAADFFEDLDVMPDAPRVLAELQRHYEIFIASAAMEVPNSFNPKFRWLQRYFPFIPYTHIVFCGDKSILRADYLIDDNPRQLAAFIGRRHPLRRPPQCRRHRLHPRPQLARNRIPLPQPEIISAGCPRSRF